MKPTSTAIFAVTRYYVERQARGATVADPEVFRDRDAALRRGAWIGRRSPAKVYAVIGEPLSDLWRKPRLIASFGGAGPITEAPSNILEFRRRA